MSDFINTIDVVGDEAAFISIIDGSITEYKDDSLTTVGTDAFALCENLHTVILSEVTEVSSGAFSGCSGLLNVDLPKVEVIYGGSGGSFNGCTGLTKITLPELRNLEGYNLFAGTTSLIIADFPKLEFLYTTWLFANGGLKALVLRNDTLCRASKLASFPVSPYIYVPSSLYDEYIQATNWSTIADRIRILEDYTVDGTTTGELDETKI